MYRPDHSDESTFANLSLKLPPTPTPKHPPPKHPPPQRPTFKEASDSDVMARTLWGEARGEPIKGIEAVASVIMNRLLLSRAAGGYWWGDTIKEICQAPYQFSCWNKNDPNLPKMLAITPEDKAFAMCLRIARRAINGTLQDPTSGATHYHAKSSTPYWAKHEIPCADIGEHVFYTHIK